MKNLNYSMIIDDRKQDQNHSKEKEAILVKMLHGKIDNLPHLPRSVVRIFISSTFSDMRAERNILSHEVFPKLKQLCLAKDLDFQVVDMRWGVTEDCQNDHSVDKICLQEVENCQKLSLGPNFVAIMGDRYGFRPIPTEISEEVFQTLRESAERIAKKPHAVKLLETWYKLDENCLPPMYILQPIRSQFPFFGDYSPGCDESRAKHTQEWDKTFADLRDILKSAALSSHQANKITNKQLHEFYISVTEKEIENGILDIKSPSQSAVVFHREIQGFTDYEDRMTKRHIDTTVENGKAVPDQEIKDLQGKLEEKVKQKIESNYFHDFTVQWLPNGIDPKASKDHKKYLDNFCEYFHNDLKSQIEAAYNERDSRAYRKAGYYSDFNEVLHHLHFCDTKCQTFCGQENIMDRVKKYILDDAMRKPFVIYAPSGNGKTSVMAMIMQSLPEWFKNKPHVGIIRFLGTSGQTLNIYDVLLSVCGQLADVAQQIMEPVGYKSMKNLQEYMPRFWRKIANFLKKPIVILLDSLDQLSSIHNAYKLQWLPTTLPQNIKLVVSTLPKEHGILDNLRAMLPDEQCYVEIPELPLETGIAIINKYLSKQNKKITESQEKVLINTFSKCPGPLFLKLILDEALKWRSYTLPHLVELEQTVQGAINKLFDNLEVKFGKIITSHALGYITIARDGISENELEDVLSCDDEALDDVYRYHNPPVDGIVRIPPVLAARIRYDIKDYIVERISSDKYTMNWYHRQFIETARNRYALGALGEKLHGNLVEIFVNEDGVKKDITLSRRKLTVPNADRQITPQPLSSKNKRMLQCLPYHITHAGKALSEQLAKEHCFCNLKFLSSKVFASSVDAVEDDLFEYLENKKDEEIKKLRNFFSLTKNDLSNPSRLAVNILSYIDADEDEPNLKRLKEQAIMYLESPDNVGLIPIYPGLAPKDGIKESMKKNMGLLAQNTVCSFDMHPNGMELVTVSRDQMLRVWLLNEAKCIKEFNIGMEAQKIVICGDDKCCLLDNKGQLKVVNLNKTYDVTIDLPTHVIDFTVGKDEVTVYTIGQKEKALIVTVLELEQGTTKDSFALDGCFENMNYKGPLKFETLHLCLSASERYLCVRSKLLPPEYKGIEASWKKRGVQLDQVNMYKFMAVDYNMDLRKISLDFDLVKLILWSTSEFINGEAHLRKHHYEALNTCIADQLPTLGVEICANVENEMMITTMRSVVFWNISKVDAGSCAQRTCKNKKYLMMNRPSWFDNPTNCKGTTKAMVRSKDGMFLALGSEDGYLCIYSIETGYPIGEKLPSTKHSASVIKVAFSPDSQWVASACQNNTIKLWDVSSGKEVFSTRVDAEVQQISFSPKSQYLVVLTGTNLTRVLIYRVHTGKV
ncbi:NACHT domain- and WD repeat-containing protein 1-like [Saccostrea cucullata]|uniref:NACHT domain- and WD repeat-containing protein 1-like n=1 Tax=Saccostrea cuccullata TaxID=36930 RepID=UPI002ED1CA1C